MMKVFVRMLLFGLLVCALGEMAQAASPAGDMALPDRVSNWGQRRNVADVMKGKLVPDSTASMKPADAIEALPRIGNAGRGFVKFLGAPKASVFATKADAKTAGVDAIAQSFMRENQQFFVTDSKQVGFKTNRVQTVDDRSFVRMSQTYKGIPVWNGSVIVQIKHGLGVAMAASDLMVDLMPLEAGILSTEPTVGSDWAEYLAKKHLAETGGQGGTIEYVLDDLVASQPELMIYDPAVVGNKGIPSLVWKMVVTREGMVFPKETYLVDAHTGDIALRHNMIAAHLYRAVHYSTAYYEGSRSNQHYVWGQNDGYGTIRRWEEDQEWAGIPRVNGNPPGYDWPADWMNAVYNPAASAPANIAFTYLGAWYNFMFSQHRRIGMHPDPWLYTHEVLNPDRPDFGIQPGTELYVALNLPINNAYYAGIHPSYGNTMLFMGTGFATADDIMAHELQHGITELGSGLILLNEAGAMNESFSDMWGEWVDLVDEPFGSIYTNNPESLEWVIGEDINVPNQGGSGNPTGFGWNSDGEARNAGLRDMRHPPYYGDPDKMSSPYWYNDLDNGIDSGAIHINSGVGNKLCYLLTKGDTFNNRTVSGFGITKSTQGIVIPWPARGTVSAPELFYEVVVNLLNPASDYEDMYYAMIQAGYNLNVTFNELVNIDKACAAVEIKPPPISEIYKITYKDRRNKNLKPFIDDISGEIIISDPEAYGTLKIKRNKSVRRGSGLPTLATIQAVRTAGTLTRVYSDVSIDKLQAAGRIDKLTTKNAYIKLVEAGEAITKVKMTAYARSWSMGDYINDFWYPSQRYTDGEYYLTAIRSQPSWPEQRLDPASKPLKVRINGISLMELTAPGQSVDVRLATKAWKRKVYGPSLYGEKVLITTHKDTSYGGMPPYDGYADGNVTNGYVDLPTQVLDGEWPAQPSLTVGELKRLKSTGAEVLCPAIFSIASSLNETKIESVAAAFTTNYASRRYPVLYYGSLGVAARITPAGESVPGRLEIHSRSLSIDVKGGFLAATNLFCDGEISRLRTIQKTYRITQDVGTSVTATSWNLYGAVGWDGLLDAPFNTPMTVWSGRDPSLDRADIGKVTTDFAYIKGNFLAGVDVIPDQNNALVTDNIRGSVGLFQVPTNDTPTSAGVYTLNTIVGNVWSKTPPKYIGHHHQMMEHELGSVLPPDIGGEF